MIIVNFPYAPKILFGVGRGDILNWDGVVAVNAVKENKNRMENDLEQLGFGKDKLFIVYPLG